MVQIASPVVSTAFGGIEETDYEVICVNDCSTDSTLCVLQELQKIHNNLKVFSNNENLRAGGARNRGVKEASGKYIVFIDADDYFHPKSAAQAVNYLKKTELDILMCDFARHTLDKPNNSLIHQFKSSGIMTGREFLVTNSLPYSPWKYFFRKSIMLDNQVYFAEKVSCEDVDWAQKIAFFADRMQYQPILLMHYVLTDTSQTATEYRNKNTVFHRLLAGARVTQILSLCENSNEEQQIINVAKSTLQNGLIFLNALVSSPTEKAKMISLCISPNIDWGVKINTIRKMPMLYATMSTVIAPLFRMAITAHRKLKKRV